MLFDTSRAAHRAQVAALRRLGPEKRFWLAAQMSQDVCRISIEGEQRRNPELTQEQARKRVLSRMWGAELAEKAFRGR